MPYDRTGVKLSEMSAAQIQASDSPLCYVTSHAPMLLTVQGLPNTMMDNPVANTPLALPST